MRRVWFAGSLVALGMLLAGMWTHRFERRGGMPVWRLADLQAVAPEIPGVTWTGGADHPAVRVQVGGGGPPVAARLVIPGMPAVGMLHMRFRLTAHGLLPGKEKWSDGRMMVEWQRPGEPAGPQIDPCTTIRCDQASGWLTFVIATRGGAAIPSLRLEHLGRAGDFELSDLEIQVVQERVLWRVGKWILLAGWLAWGIFWIKLCHGVGGWRAMGAASIALGVAVACVVPGPWKIQRPLAGIAFQLGAAAGAAQPVTDRAAAPSGAAGAPASAAGAVPAMGELPEQGSWILRVKRQIRQARPLLHMLLLFGPTLAMAWLAGAKPARTLAIGLALGTELAQFSFGYGLDWIDAFDLLFDAAGIILGLRACLRLKQWWAARGALTKKRRNVSAVSHGLTMR